MPDSLKRQRAVLLASLSIALLPLGCRHRGFPEVPDGYREYAYITNGRSNTVSVLDLVNLRADRTLRVGDNPTGIAANPRRNEIYAVNTKSGTVSVIDTASRKVTKVVDFHIKGIAKDRIQPVGVKLTDDGRYAFVALGPANHVAVVDAKTFEVKDYLLVGRRVWQLALTPDQKTLYTTNGVSGDVSVIDVDGLKVTKTVKVGRYPWGVAVKG